MHSAGRPAVEITGLVKRYGAKTAVQGLDLAVEPGSLTALLGPNGAGKTTTIECCEGYRRPDGGTVRVLGLDPVADAAALRPRVGVMLQSGGIYQTIRAMEMLRHIASMYRDPLDVDALAERLGLESCGKTPFRRLSGGQQQRLSLALAVVGRPELVFLDEPTAGLDVQARHATWELIEQLRADGVTIVLTTHLLDEAERLADTVAIIDAGRVIACDSPQRLAEATRGLARPGGQSAGGSVGAPTGRDAGASDAEAGAAAGAGTTGTGSTGASSTGVGSNVTDSIRFEAPAGLDLAELIAAVGRDCSAAEYAPGAYRVTGAVTPGTLAAATAWCARLGFMPRNLTVEQRSLEDVFLDLTGRGLR